MSIVHMRHIKKAIETDFSGLIDLTDVSGKTKAEQDNVFLTRGLVAYSLTVLADVEPQIAAKSVTDSFHDNGLDLIFYDKTNKTLYVGQSKWSHNGSKTIELGDALKFIVGVEALVSTDFSSFGANIQKRASEITDALDDTDTRIVLFICYTGTQKLPDEAETHINKLLEKLNDTSDVVRVEVLTQSELHQAVAGQVQGKSIGFDIVLQNWGQIQEPFHAFYGQVEAADVAEWWIKHRNGLFTENLRNFKGSTDVNDAIHKTLELEPERFFYLNNGLTVLCASAKKKIVNGTNREMGIFECEGISVVNGAQTVGSIAAAFAKHPEKVRKARLLLRLFSLESCPEEFGRVVTVATNTQNRIERVDFVALDPEQKRLQTDLHFEGKEYSYRSGDAVPSFDKGCSITEATIALACAHSDSALAVQAKREIGKLWENIQKPPYRSIFNPSLTATRLWRTVQVLRRVELSLELLKPTFSGRYRLILVHGNRLILHAVFKGIAESLLNDHEADFELVLNDLGNKVSSVLPNFIRATNSLYKTAYPASLFKNAAKCKEIMTALKL